jgi:hypothetical protein
VSSDGGKKSRKSNAETYTSTKMRKILERREGYGFRNKIKYNIIKYNKIIYYGDWIGGH